MMVGRTEVLKLYKALLKESQKFSSFNYRHYAVRRVRDTFKENKNLQDPIIISEYVRKGYENLAMIKRQVVIGQLYHTEKLILEH